MVIVSIENSADGMNIRTAIDCGIGTDVCTGRRFVFLGATVALNIGVIMIGAVVVAGATTYLR